MSARSKPITGALLARWPLPSMAGLEGKESRGRVLVVGGSASVPGAVLLAGASALRVGAGKLQIATVETAAVPMAMQMPEALVFGLPQTRDGEIRASGARLHAAASQTDALLIGPGMRSGPTTTRLARALLDECIGPAVLDAGALAACMSLPARRTTAASRANKKMARPTLATGTPKDRIVVTPHAGEMAGLLDIDADDVAADPETVARDFAHAHGVVTVLKGATTVIAAPDGRRWIHTGGCLGLGTSGSGDVLAGAIAGLLARGAEPAQAAAWAVYLHGRAGVRLARRVGPVGFLAREIAGEFPALLRDVRQG